jgi:plasmid stability protein
MTESATVTRDRDREAVIFRVEPEFKQELARRAREHDRSVDAEVRSLLRAALAHEKEGDTHGT